MAIITFSWLAHISPWAFKFSHEKIMNVTSFVLGLTYRQLSMKHRRRVGFRIFSSSVQNPTECVVSM